MKNLFSSKRRFTAQSFKKFAKGHIEEVEFATTVWETGRTA